MAELYTTTWKTLEKSDTNFHREDNTMDQFIWAYQLALGFVFGVAFGLAVLMRLGIDILALFGSDDDDKKE